MGAALGSSELELEVAQLSDPGRDPNKQVNEDSCGYLQTAHGHLCVLCDGMGGHAGGQEASRRAIKTIFEQVEAASGGAPKDILKNAIEEAARRVYELGGPPENKVRPGSTVVAMLLHDAGVDVAHVGDSRAYVIRSGQIYPLTRDHSMVQAMIDAGFLSEEQAMGHPDANKITRALGMKPEVLADVRPETMELFAGDILITASDGLTDLALGKDILGATKQALASGGLDSACATLVRMANDRGGHDNITVQLARVKKAPARKTRSGETHAPVANTVVGNTVPGQPVAGVAAQVAGGAAPVAGGPVAGGPVAGGPVAGGPAAGAPQQAEAATTLGHQHSGTIPMRPAATAHDGTAPSAAAMGGMQLSPPPPHAHVPAGLQQALETPAPGMAAYRLDSAAQLQLPPSSMRYPNNGAAAVGMQGPQPTLSGPPMGVAPTPAMPAGGGAGWMNPGAPYAAGAAAAPSPHGVHAMGPAPTMIPSSRRGHGGGVLFLVLAVSFVVAATLMLIVWLFFLR